MKDKINEIAVILSNQYHQLPRISLKDGRLGAALFLTSYSKFSKDKKYNKLTVKILNEVLDDINSGYTSDTLGKEMADLGSFLCYVKDQQLLSFRSEQILSDLDLIASDFVDKNIRDLDFDPITGFLAQGYYFLKRDTKISRMAIMKIVNAIKHISEKDADGHLFWRSAKFSNGGIYTGITHGSCGIIQFLLKVDLKYKLEKDIKKIIVESINFLLKNKLPFEDYNFYFPTKIGDEIVKTPVEWCYGDLCVGYTILNSGFHLQNEMFKQMGIKILENTVKRTSKENYIDDASLSYGSTGIAMVLKKSLLIYNSKHIQDAYMNSIDKALKHAKFQNKFAGYRAFFYTDSEEINLGLMTGISGIGLALLTHLNDKYLPFTQLLYL